MAARHDRARIARPVGDRDLVNGRLCDQPGNARGSSTSRSSHFAGRTNAEMRAAPSFGMGNAGTDEQPAFVVVVHLDEFAGGLGMAIQQWPQRRPGEGTTPPTCETCDGCGQFRWWRRSRKISCRIDRRQQRNDAVFRRDAVLWAEALKSSDIAIAVVIAAPSPRRGSPPAAPWVFPSAG